ncbi:MAG: AAA family ATPase [Desulfobacula sp.]
MGEKHKEALAILKYGILDNKGFLLLTGDVGTGKTTLINALLQSLSDDIISTTVPDPGLEKLDFFNYIAAGFGLEKEFLTKGTFLAHFRKFLIQANEDKKKVLLIIDEAQLLTQEMLEEIRLLSNIEKTDAKLINIFFIGQNEFNEILNRDQNRAVRQRLTLNYNIDPLTPDETGEYIRHRLSIAGATYPIFNEEGIQEVFLNSGGFPRRINVICDHSLLSGYVKEKKIIDGAIVKECAIELKIPSSVRNRDINGFVAGNAPEVFSINPANSKFLLEQSVTKRKKTIWNRLIFLIGLIICFAIFFYVFPDLFNKNIKTLTQRVLQIYPDNKASSEKRDNRNEAEGSVVSTETKENDKVEMPIINNDIQGEGSNIKDKEPTSVEKIHPIAEEVSKSEITQSLDQRDGIKEITPLPTEKVVVRFKYNNNDFTDDALNKLIDFSNILVMHPDVKIVVTGYTDAEGYENYNQKLSEFRANIVRSFFLGRGIKPDQIEVIGSGSKKPIESNDTALGRTMNRRVEIEVKKK